MLTGWSSCQLTGTSRRRRCCYAHKRCHPGVTLLHLARTVTGDEDRGIREFIVSQVSKYPMREYVRYGVMYTCARSALQLIPHEVSLVPRRREFTLRPGLFQRGSETASATAAAAAATSRLPVAARSLLPLCVVRRRPAHLPITARHSLLTTRTRQTLPAGDILWSYVYHRI